MKNLFLLLTIITLTACKAQTNGNTTVIDLKDLKTEVIGKEVQLVDVRTKKEYDNGYIDNAISISISDKDNFKKEIQKLDKTKPIYIYCHVGGRSNRASKIMEDLGFLSIYDFSGGWKVWSN